MMDVASATNALHLFRRFPGRIPTASTRTDPRPHRCFHGNGCLDLLRRRVIMPSISVSRYRFPSYITVNAVWLYGHFARSSVWSGILPEPRLSFPIRQFAECRSKGRDCGVFPGRGNVYTLRARRARDYHQTNSCVSSHWLRKKFVDGPVMAPHKGIGSEHYTGWKVEAGLKDALLSATLQRRNRVMTTCSRF